MEWTDYRDALVRGLWLIAVLGIIGAGVGLLLPKTVVHPDWVTNTSVGAPPAVNGVGSPIPSGVTTDQIQFYAASDGVFTEAATLAHIDEPQSVLRSWVTVTGPCGANCSAGSGTLPGIVDISVKAPSSVESATFNIGFDEALQLAVAASATTLNNGQPVATGFRVLQTTQPDFAYPTKTTAQTFASRPLRAVLGALIGLLLGIVIALLRGLMDKRVSTVRRAEVAVGYPVVAEIPPGDPADPGEAYRMLWLSVFRDPLPEPLEEEADKWLEGMDLREDAVNWRELDA
jgi:hypothetical protein